MMTAVIRRTKKEVIEQWIKALRSGKYKQTTGLLKESLNKHKKDAGKVGFCCLGVLCDLAAKDGGEQWVHTENDTYRMHGQSGLLPKKFSAWLELSSKDVEDLIEMNDEHRAKFPRIAKHIETKILPKYA